MIKKAKTLIISCERSGLNLFRLMTELYTGHMTPGNSAKYNIGNKKLAFVRSHNIKMYGVTPKGYEINKMILLLRHPVRHWVALGDRGMKQYADNISEYDKFSGDKMVMHYEDLVKYEDAYYKAWEFIGLKYKNIGNFDESMKYTAKIYEKVKLKEIKVRDYSGTEKTKAVSKLKSIINEYETTHVKKYL